jgi:hypothetical protein
MSLQDDRMLLKSIAEKYKTTVSTRVYVDKGHSAFTGKNLENELGTLLLDIENKVIVAGDIIVLRHLDRLSRLSLTGAMEIYIKILKHKVKIYTTIDGFLYGSDNDNPLLGQFLATLAFATANEESVKKSYLTNRHAMERIRQFEAGERTSCGHSFDLGVGSAPFHIKVTDRAVKADKIKFPIAKDLIKYALKGNGLSKCVNWLNSEHQIKYTTAGMSNLLRSEALFGRLVANIQDRDDVAFLNSTNNRDEYKIKKYVLDGFYPAVCSENEYYQLQAMIKSRTRSNGNRKKYTLLAGRKFLKCGCGSSMTANHTSGQGAVYYTCCDANCLFSIKIYVLDNIVVSALGEYFINGTLAIDDIKLKGLEERRSVKTELLNLERNYMIDNRHVLPDDFIERRLEPITDEIKYLDAQIESERNKVLSSSIDAKDISKLTTWGERVKEIITSGSDEKQEYQNTISKVISKIVAHADGLIEVKLINDNVKYFYIPEQMKSTGRRLAVKLNVYDDENQEPYPSLKLDKNFKKVSFTKEEIRSKKYQCKVDEINETLLRLYSEERTRYTAQERFINKLLATENRLGYYILTKQFAMSFKDELKYSISDKQWQSYKSKCKPILTSKKILYCLNYVTVKGNITKDFILCAGDVRGIYSKLKDVLEIKKIIGCSLVS